MSKYPGSCGNSRKEQDRHNNSFPVAEFIGQGTKEYGGDYIHNIGCESQLAYLSVGNIELWLNNRHQKGNNQPVHEHETKTQET